MNRLQEQYLKSIRPSLVEKLGYTSIMQAPMVAKIVVNMGVGDAITNTKALDDAVNEMTQRYKIFADNNVRNIESV